MASSLFDIEIDGVRQGVVEVTNPYVACVPDISCDRCFVEELAHRCNEGQLSPMHLIDVVLDALA